MHQPYRSALCPLLPCLQKLAESTPGILGAVLSGAGPSVLIFLGEKDGQEMKGKLSADRVTAKVRAHLRAHGLEAEPIANGDIKNVRLILTAGASQLKALGLSDLAALGTDCELQWFVPADWELLAREFTVDRGLDRALAEPLIEWKSQKLRNASPDARWGRDELDAMVTFMGQVK